MNAVDSFLLTFRSDPYENIYTVVKGIKYFTLVPPPNSYRLNGTPPTLEPHDQDANA